LRPEAVLWRIKLLDEIIADRLKSVDIRVKAGMIKADEVELLVSIIGATEVWVMMNSDEDKQVVKAALEATSLRRRIEVFGPADVAETLAGLS
jgi:hypothetical protein